MVKKKIIFVSKKVGYLRVDVSYFATFMLYIEFSEAFSIINIWLPVHELKSCWYL